MELILLALLLVLGLAALSDHWDKRNRRSQCDQKCPFCDVWQSQCGGWSKIRTIEPGEYRLECGNCESWSRWSFNAPVAICLEPKEQELPND